jgi:hypothetical protein
MYELLIFVLGFSVLLLVTSITYAACSKPSDYKGKHDTK